MLLGWREQETCTNPPPVPALSPLERRAGMNARAAALAYARNLKAAAGLAPGLGLGHAHHVRAPW